MSIITVDDSLEKELSEICIFFNVRKLNISRLRKNPDRTFRNQKTFSIDYIVTDKN